MSNDPLGFPNAPSISPSQMAREYLLKEMRKFNAHAASNLASQFHKRLVQWISTFDASLDDRYEVGVRLVSFGQSVTFHLTNLGYWDPSLVSFTGLTAEGDPVELIQHVSQISILLLKLPRADPSKPKEPIGFYLFRLEGLMREGPRFIMQKRRERRRTPGSAADGSRKGAVRR